MHAPGATAHPLATLLAARSQLFLGKSSDAIRGLQALSGDRTVSLAAALALRDAHKQAQHVDKEAIGQLDTQIKADVKTCGTTALYHGAVYLWQAGKHDKVRDLQARCAPWLLLYAGSAPCCIRIVVASRERALKCTLFGDF